MWEQGPGAAAAAAGGEFLQFCENVPKRCWWGEGGGEGAPLVREQVMVMGRHRCDALDMGTCAALGSFAQQLDFVDTVCN